MRAEVGCFRRERPAAGLTLSEVASDVEAVGFGGLREHDVVEVDARGHADDGRELCGECETECGIGGGEGGGSEECA